MEQVSGWQIFSEKHYIVNTLDLVDQWFLWQLTQLCCQKQYVN